ncbi:hypothetical protein B1748_18580 [Paenibacillus sp. MY03]|uniref:flagellar protein FlaG n=1 Tax=Paenibacillus TaxID=44249 RepID=UPI000B3D113B|nr:MULTISPECIES: flagellar protein FlaG [Paenibacillus]OUS75145.1 hypothetical protein B1748_18580 [Paenibacillus sp. MY03]
MITGIAGGSYSGGSQAESRPVAREYAQYQQNSEPITPTPTSSIFNQPDTGVKKSIGDEQWDKILSAAVKDLQGPNTSLSISVHEESNQLLIKVVNKDSGDVIREIPPEKTLDYLANLLKFAGIIIDKKV